MKQELDEWEFEMLQTLERFRETWEKLHSINAEIYPLSMDHGEWDIQFKIFLDRNQ